MMVGGRTLSSLSRSYQDLQPLMDADPTFKPEDFWPGTLDACHLKGFGVVAGGQAVLFTATAHNNPKPLLLQLPHIDVRLMFQETSQAFVDVNGSFVLRLDLGCAFFYTRFLVQPVGESHKCLLKDG
jgi:hypothetical protein